MTAPERPLRQQIGDYLTKQFVYDEPSDLPLDECLIEADNIIRMVIDYLQAQRKSVQVTNGIGWIALNTIPGAIRLLEHAVEAPVSSSTGDHDA